VAEGQAALPGVEDAEDKSESELKPELASELNPESIQDATLWLDIEITADDYLADAQKRIAVLVEPLPVEVLLLRRARKNRTAVMSSTPKETLTELSPADVFERRLAQEDWSGEGGEERLERLREHFAHVVAELENPESETEAGDVL